MQKLEHEFYHHTMVGTDHTAYTDRFHELARLVPHMVTPESKRIERYIYGLVPEIRGMVKATEPPTIQSAILKAATLTDEMVRNGTFSKSGDKRKAVSEPSKQGGAKGDNKKAKWGKGFVETTSGEGGYAGEKCNYHHPETKPC